MISYCPDECKEAIPSLMYAASRFSDFPELRDLKVMFKEKFGDSLEPFLSKEVRQMILTYLDQKMLFSLR